MTKLKGANTSGGGPNNQLELKFFTPKLYAAAHDENKWDDVYAATSRYDEYVASIKSRLHPSVAAVAESRQVDDALLVQARFDSKAKAMMISLRCGDLQVGYYNLVFRYFDAEITKPHLSTLAAIADGTKTATWHAYDAWRHEVDVLKDGRFEHRLAFRSLQSAPCVWLAVNCKRFLCVRQERKSRRLPPLQDRLVIT